MAQLCCRVNKTLSCRVLLWVRSQWLPWMTAAHNRLWIARHLSQTLCSWWARARPSNSNWPLQTQAHIRNNLLSLANRRCLRGTLPALSLSKQKHQERVKCRSSSRIWVTTAPVTLCASQTSSNNSSTTKILIPGYKWTKSPLLKEVSYWTVKGKRSREQCCPSTTLKKLAI